MVADFGASAGALQEELRPKRLESAVLGPNDGSCLPADPYFTSWTVVPRPEGWKQR